MIVGCWGSLLDSAGIGSLLPNFQKLKVKTVREEAKSEEWFEVW
jgi:hypothetical protein